MRDHTRNRLERASEDAQAAATPPAPPTIDALRAARDAAADTVHAARATLDAIRDAAAEARSALRRAEAAYQRAYTLEIDEVERLISEKP